MTAPKLDEGRPAMKLRVEVRASFRYEVDVDIMDEAEAGAAEAAVRADVSTKLRAQFGQHFTVSTESVVEES